MKAVFAASPSGRRQIEVQALFALVPGSAQKRGGGSGCELGSPCAFELWITLLTGAVTRTCTQLLSMLKNSTQGGPVPLPVLPSTGAAAAGSSAQGELTLSVYVDRSMVEAFALGGRAVVTSRIYPTPVGTRAPGGGLQDNEALGLQEVGAWGVQVGARWPAGDVRADMTVHELGSCWVDAV
jgi:hypothetical protein